MQKWFQNGRNPKDMCQALISLTPKQPSLNIVKQFRPISLCNTLYKLVTKILVMRLKLVIPTWYPLIRITLLRVGGLKILNVLWLRRFSTSWRRKRIYKRGWFALKINLEKAYDRVK